MPGKAKTQKHTAKELKGKEFAATVNRGGGSAGVSDRKVCPHVVQSAVGLSSRAIMPEWCSGDAR